MIMADLVAIADVVIPWARSPSAVAATAYKFVPTLPRQ